MVRVRVAHFLIAYEVRIDLPAQVQLALNAGNLLVEVHLSRFLLRHTGKID